MNARVRGATRDDSFIKPTGTYSINISSNTLRKLTARVAEDPLPTSVKATYSGAANEVFSVLSQDVLRRFGA